MQKEKRIDNRDFYHAVCHLNIIPVFNKPLEGALMINQMLYGETCSIITKRNKHWVKIQMHSDRSTGWVKTSQIKLTDEKTCESLRVNPARSLELLHTVFNDNNSVNIVLGSLLPSFDGMSFKMLDGKYVFNQLAAQYNGLDKSPELLVKVAKKYLNTPELLGGRTPFGIDGGALIQMVYSFFGVELPRYPSEQILAGKIIYFSNLAQEGDVAFCIDNDGDVCHAGIVVGENEVLHVYGSVRIDKFDHFGFYNRELRKYTHKIRLIKRILM